MNYFIPTYALSHRVPSQRTAVQWFSILPPPNPCVYVQPCSRRSTDMEEEKAEDAENLCQVPHHPSLKSDIPAKHPIVIFVSQRSFLEPGPPQQSVWTKLALNYCSIAWCMFDPFFRCGWRGRSVCSFGIVRKARSLMFSQTSQAYCLIFLLSVSSKNWFCNCFGDSSWIKPCFFGAQNKTKSKPH